MNNLTYQSLKSKWSDRVLQNIIMTPINYIEQYIIGTSNGLKITAIQKSEKNSILRTQDQQILLETKFSHAILPTINDIIDKTINYYYVEDTICLENKKIINVGCIDIIKKRKIPNRANIYAEPAGFYEIDDYIFKYGNVIFIYLDTANQCININNFYILKKNVLLTKNDIFIMKSSDDTFR